MLKSILHAIVRDHSCLCVYSTFKTHQTTLHVGASSKQCARCVGIFYKKKLYQKLNNKQKIIFAIQTKQIKRFHI